MNNTSIMTIIISGIIGLIVSLLMGPIIIPILHKLKFGQNIREDGPRTHLKKAGTPTIGALIFIISTTIAMLIMNRSFTNEAMIAFYAFLGFGFIGFLDDLLKIIQKQNLGLRAWQKMILILIVSGALAYYGNSKLGTDILIPFTSIHLNLGALYIPFIILYFAGATNAVNLTDGLDGLATSITILVLTFFTVVSINIGYSSLAIFSVALIGGLLGFLKFNAYPAKVFMGDTGSLALGGAVATIAMILKLEILLAIVGLIYVTETLSVIIQVVSFKLTGKRVFRMAPIHHHFEKLGWSETRIVTTFSIITVILCFVGFLAI